MFRLLFPKPEAAIAQGPDIANYVQPLYISEIANELNLSPDHYDLYGKYKAKVLLSVHDELKGSGDGYYVVVGGITPTPLGEGKSTTTVGLCQALGAFLDKKFSPTSEHLLLAYGRHHSSLLKSFVIEGETTIPIYTILEVYRVSDMELVRVLSSAEDEVNVACFHPLVGNGFAYGTKEGKLRILQCERSHRMRA